MTTDHHDTETITDFITGQPLPNVGAEANRQSVEKILVNRKHFRPDDIRVNYPIEVTIGGGIYRSRIDLVIGVGGRWIMAVKCAAGSLGSRQREILAAARLLNDYQIPLSIVSDGTTAIVWDTLDGREIGTGLDAIPDRQGAERIASTTRFIPYPRKRREREAIIFRSYDTMNINITRTNGDVF